jgi:RNA-directed DNA polymerase
MRALYGGIDLHSNNSVVVVKPTTTLGFTHYWGRTRKGRWAVQRKTAAKRFTRAVRTIAPWCRAHRHEPIAEQHKVLGRKLKGHGAYYGITGNAGALARFRHEMYRAWQRWLNRRGQRKGMSWERFEQLLQQYALPQVVVVHSVFRHAARP